MFADDYHTSLCLSTLQIVRNLLKNTTSKECSIQYPYTGQVCHTELLIQQDKCSPNSSLVLANITDANQNEIEQYLNILLTIGFPNFEPSPECDSAFRKFFCAFIFGACNRNLSPLATRDKCKDVRDNLCVKEWLVINKIFISQAQLPICEDLPESISPKCEFEGIAKSFMSLAMHVLTLFRWSES